MFTTILIFLAVLSLLVLVHEWGHYFFARKIGLGVEEFGLGFPPRLFTWKGKDGMIWSLNAIPLGGFVRIKGESGDSLDDPNSFRNKSIPGRLLVLGAGVMMNFVLAAVLFSAVFAIGTTTVVEGGIEPFAHIEDRAITVSQVLEGSPAAFSGIEAGDEILKINGVDASSSEMARELLVPENEQDQFSITLLRGDEEVSVTATPSYIKEIDRSGIGVGFLETAEVRYPIYYAPIKGIEVTAKVTWQILVAFFEIIRNLIVGQPIGVDLAGPVGIAAITGEAAALGIVYLMQFAAILSINLAILNILPFPALDGGRIVFVLYEALRGKPASPKVEAVVHNLGFLVLLLLIIFVTYKDILGLFG